MKEWKELTEDEIDAAREDAVKSFKKYNASIRGQQLSRLDDPEWHFAQALLRAVKYKNVGGE